MVLILAIAFSWKDFSARLKNALETAPAEQINREK